jgi:hypothetical protein
VKALLEELVHPMVLLKVGILEYLGEYPEVSLLILAHHPVPNQAVAKD